MKNIKIIISWLLIVVASLQVGYCQLPDASANFVKVEKEITTTPEFPGICDPEKGTMVTINETFMIYIWTSPSGTIKEGKSVTLNEPGNWKIEVKFIENEVECTRSTQLFIADLSNPFEIRKYFQNAGFWPVQIYRSPINNIACRNCDCETGLESVGFEYGGDYIKLTTEFENFANFRPFQGMDYQKNITNNSCLCNEDGTSNIEQLEADLGSSELSVWGHQFFKDPNTYSGTLYLKASMSWEASSPSGAHKSRLNTIKSQILTQNPGTINQARVLFTNLFMTNPIEGYTPENECARSLEFTNYDNFLTPSGAVIEKPKNSTNLVFSASDLYARNTSSSLFEGSLIGFLENGEKVRKAYIYLDEKFAGYYDEISATVSDDLVSPQITNFPAKVEVVLPRFCEGECVKWKPEINGISYVTDNYGAIGESLDNEVIGADNSTFSCIPKIFENLDKSTVTFLSGTGGLISMIRKNVVKSEFSYGAFSSAGSTVENLVSGILWEFKLDGSEGPTGTFKYDQTLKEYINSETGVAYIDNTPESVINGFVYLLSCDGNYQLYKLGKGSLQKHSNLAPSIYNDFDNFTNQFIPFLGSYAKIEGPETIYDNYTCPWCPGELSAQIVSSNKNYCGSPEHIFVDKIGQLATVFPDYFAFPVGSGQSYWYSFTQPAFPDHIENGQNWEIPSNLPPLNLNADTDWEWGKYLAQNEDVRQQFTSDKVTFFRKFIEEFKKFNTSKTNWWCNSLNSSTPINEIVSHLKIEPQYITENVPWMCKSIALNTLLNSNSWLNDGRQNAIIHILASSDNGATEALEMVENKGIQNLWDDFAEAYGTTNRARLFFAISSLINTVGPNYSMDIAPFMDDANVNNIPATEADILTWTNPNYSVIGNKVRIGSLPEVPYNTLIPLKNGGEFTVGGNHFENGLILHVPAIQAAAMVNSNNFTMWESVGWTAVDIGLLYMGMYGARATWATASLAQKTFLVSDIVGSAIGISSNLINSSVMSIEAKSRIQLAALLFSLPTAWDQLTNINRVGNSIDEMHLASNLPSGFNPSLGSELSSMADSYLGELITRDPRYGPQYADLSDEILAVVDDACPTVACRLDPVTGRYGCFAANTFVQTSHGKKEIKSVQIGDNVLTHNHTTGTNEMNDVTSLKSFLVKSMVALVLSNGDTLWTTDSHPFYTETGYKNASNITKNDQLKSKDGQLVNIIDIMTVDTLAMVYNFETDANQNYYVGNQAILTGLLCDRIASRPTLRSKLNTLSTELKGKLYADLRNASDEFLDFLNNNPRGVDTWELINEFPQLRNDLATLKSLAKVIDDPYLSSLNLWPDIIRTRWIEQFNLACLTCTSNVKPYISDVIDALDHFKQYQSVTGYDQVLAQLLGTQKKKLIGSHWVMRYTKKRDEIPSAFEELIDEVSGDFSADIRYGDEFVECKSWSGNQPGMGNVPAQMIYYFKTQTNLGNFQFQFDPDRWVPSPTDLNTALKANDHLFGTFSKAEWDRAVTMLGGDPDLILPGNTDDLIDLISNSTNFPKIVNPL
ncbi:MAG TPA: polymorphic toxin-type HINT domain-containing protein [Saprospiraceae bacterium]|jgi:hypothetical protein|nr:polymorphic toxin-type HINT domain-containing protein [Saprospiraceae bacterium]